MIRKAASGGNGYPPALDPRSEPLSRRPRPQLDLFSTPTSPSSAEGRDRGESLLPIDTETEPQTMVRETSLELPAVLTVGELARRIRGTLESGLGTIHVRGEISNLRKPGSGHLYFSLKDEWATIRAVLFRGQARLLRFRPDNGQEVVARGRVTFYEAGGDAQLVCDGLDPVGAGALALAFEQLKAKLAGEGLFDPSRKRALPFIPWRIGVVTSPTGAAIRDFLQVLHRRFPGIAVRIAPCRVQGAGASQEIADAVRLLDEGGEVEVIVVTRGGGSIEDLWAFNEEVVARAIAESRTPVVSAVGHEVDFTIADFVADLRAPTPTGAAELLVPVEAELRAGLAVCKGRLVRGARQAIERKRGAARERLRRLGDPRRRIVVARLALDGRQQRALDALRRALAARRRRLDEWGRRLHRANPAQRLQSQRKELAALQRRLGEARLAILRRREEFARKKARLLALSPLAVLSRGYAIAFSGDGKVVRAPGDVSAGEAIHLELGEGALELRVIGRGKPRK